MALPSSLKARIQDMEDTRQRLLQRLQAEKELHKSKNLLLSKQRAQMVKIQKRSLLLKQKDAELSMKILEKEEDLRNDNEKLNELCVKRRNLQLDLDNLERQRQEKLKYYEQNKITMDAHQCRIQHHMLTLKTEVEDLNNFCQKMETRLKELQDTGQVTQEIDAEIKMEERKRDELLAEIHTVEAQIRENDSMKTELEHKVHSTLMDVDEKKAALEKQRLEIMELQIENQSLENRLLEVIQLRDQRKRDANFMKKQFIEK